MFSNLNYQQSIIDVHYAVRRRCTSDWCIDGPNAVSNLILVYEGSAFVQYGECEGKIAKAGDLIYFPKGVMRKGHTFKEDLMKCYAISFTMQKKIKANCVEPCELPLNFVEHINVAYVKNNIQERLKQINNVWQSNEAFKEYKLSSNFFLLLQTILEWKHTQKFNDAKSNKVQRVIEYIDNNMKSPLTIEKISSHINVSASYLSRIFKEITGKTIVYYINEQKINSSKKLLLEGISVGECAETLGYSDIYYFSKLFKKYENTTPTEFKQSHI